MCSQKEWHLANVSQKDDDQSIDGNEEQVGYLP